MLDQRRKHDGGAERQHAELEPGGDVQLGLQRDQEYLSVGGRCRRSELGVAVAGELDDTGGGATERDGGCCDA